MTAIDTNAKVAVIGAGTMGAGIAQVAAQAGHEVLVFDAVEGAAKAGIDQTAKGLDRLVEREKITAARRDEIIGRMVPVAAMEELAPAALVIEAIVEKLDVKRDVFAALETICRPGTLLATNTSSLSVTAIGAALQRPEDFVGVHFFNPAAIMKLVEIVSGAATSQAATATAFDTVTGWGKKAVHAKSTPGFIVNRVARPFYAEALRVLEEGAAEIATIDAVMRQSGGFRMGPFQLMDLIGNDVNFAVTKSVYEAFYWDPRYLPSLVQEDLVAAGRLGRKSGRGFYDYGEGAQEPEPSTLPPSPAPERVTIFGPLGVAEPLIDMAAKAGIHVDRGEGDWDPGTLIVDGVNMHLTDGSTASECAARHGQHDWVLFDLALDYEASTRVALAVADQATEKAVSSAGGFFQALGKSVSMVDDIPGMIVMRTLAMLANEGADAVRAQVCDAASVDIAMCNGVNYPLGPIEWAGRLGLGTVETVLDNMARIYGEDRYRCSPLIRRKAIAGASF